MASGSSAQNSQQARLDTWKSIAQYLGRSSRTVQRWHSNYGLPVVHLSGESGSVYAFSDELDRWLRGRGQESSFEDEDRRSASVIRPLDKRDGASNYGPSSEPPLISGQAQSRSSRLIDLAQAMWSSVSHRNLTAIIHHYREAIDLNPENAEAYAGLSLAFIQQGLLGPVYPPHSYAVGAAALEHALTIDCDLPLAKCAKAWLAMVSRRDWEIASRGFDEILKAFPSCTRSMNGRALLFIAEGRIDLASAILLKAAQEVPLSSVPMALCCWCAYLTGDHVLALDRVDEVRATERPSPILDAVEALSAIQFLDDRARLDHLEELAMEYPKHDVLRGALGFIHAKRGQSSKARELLGWMTEKKFGRSRREPYAIALILIGLNEPQKAAPLLEQSYRNGSLWSLGFKADPILKFMRDDSPYRRLFAKLGYPEAEIPVVSLGPISELSR